MAEPDDPFLWAMAPPPFETPAQRAEREADEEKARRMNELIDEQIHKGMLERRKRSPVKVLLLGRENCGTSTFVYFASSIFAVFSSSLIRTFACPWGCCAGKEAFLRGPSSLGVSLSHLGVCSSHSCQAFGIRMHGSDGKKNAKCGLPSFFLIWSVRSSRFSRRWPTLPILLTASGRS